MMKVGITGGIGSGKTIVCQVFSKFGVPVYYADLASRELTENDPEIRDNLVKLLGQKVFSGKSLNRAMMASMIFNNRQLLQQVNQIVHPKVAEHFGKWCLNHSRDVYIIQESALLFESNAYLMFDRYVTVASPEEIRIKRIITRQDMSYERIRAIMENQLPDEERKARSHHVVINDDITPLLPQLLQLHQLFSTQV
jgi:dephospho-CoA kinase